MRIATIETARFYSKSSRSTAPAPANPQHCSLSSSPSLLFTTSLEPPPPRPTTFYWASGVLPSLKAYLSLTITQPCLKITFVKITFRSWNIYEEAWRVRWMAPPVWPCCSSPTASPTGPWFVVVNTIFAIVDLCRFIHTAIFHHRIHLHILMECFYKGGKDGGGEADSCTRFVHTCLWSPRGSTTLVSCKLAENPSLVCLHCT